MSGHATDESDRIGVLEALRATPPAIRYLLGGMLINQLGAFVQTFLLLYLTHLGLPAAAAGVCLVAYSVGSIFGSALGGELTGRIGPRTTITVAMALSAPLVACLPLVARSGLSVQLLAVALAAGLVTQAYRPAAAVLLSDHMPERFHTISFSMMRTALNIGAAVAPLIAAALILLDWDLLFWLDGGTAALYSLLAFVFLPKLKPAGNEDAAESTVEPAMETRGAYRILLQDRQFLCFLGAVGLGTLIYVQSTVALPLQIEISRYPTALYSAVLAISSIVLITCELKITTFTVRLPKPVAALSGHLVNSVGLALLVFSGLSPVFVIAGEVLCVVGIMMAGPSMFAHPATFPAGVKARYIATMQVVAGIAMAVGPVFGVYALSGLHASFWVLAAVINAAAGLLAMVSLRTRTEVPTTPAAPETVVRQSEPDAVGGVA